MLFLYVKQKYFQPKQSPMLEILTETSHLFVSTFSIFESLLLFSRKVCSQEKYGLLCSQTCGSCKDGQCNSVDGRCAAGCATGFNFKQDSQCKTGYK